MINAQYTIPLCNLVEAGFDIGLKDYPIWNEEHRNVLNDKIIKHYWFREIGAETPELFKFYLNRTLEEIMPYYNELYKTTMFEYNPIHNVDYTEEYTIGRDRVRKDVTSSTTTMEGSSTDTVDSEGKLNGTTESEVNGNSSGRDTHVDTPQGVVGLNEEDNVTYATTVDFKSNEDHTDSNTTSSQTSENNTTSTGSSESTGTFSGNTNTEVNDVETYSRHLAGNYGVKTSQAMIREERDLIINIDMMIIKDLADCFMNIY